MTRIMKCTNSITAIILCIIIVSVSLCSLVCVQDYSRDNTQFFAAHFSFVSARRESFVSSPGVKIVSWIRRQDILPDELTFSPETPFDIKPFSDKPALSEKLSELDAYTTQKSTLYNLRI